MEISLEQQDPDMLEKWNTAIHDLVTKLPGVTTKNQCSLLLKGQSLDHLLSLSKVMDIMYSSITVICYSHLMSICIFFFMDNFLPFYFVSNQTKMLSSTQCIEKHPHKHMWIYMQVIRLFRKQVGLAAFTILGIGNCWC